MASTQTLKMQPKPRKLRFKLPEVTEDTELPFYVFQFCGENDRLEWIDREENRPSPKVMVKVKSEEDSHAGHDHGNMEEDDDADEDDGSSGSAVATNGEKDVNLASASSSTAAQQFSFIASVVMLVSVGAVAVM